MSTLSEEECLPEINVLVFGKTGVGKTSLLNGVTGSSYVVSDSAGGTTFDTQIGHLDHGGKRYIFHDTAGLNEPDSKYATVKPLDAFRKLKQLVKTSRKGFNLIIFVMTKDKITQTDHKNAEMFCKILGKCLIPTVIVVNKSDSGIANPEALKDNSWINANINHLKAFDDDKFKISGYQETSFPDVDADSLISKETRIRLNAISKNCVMENVLSNCTTEPVLVMTGDTDLLDIFSRIWRYFMLYVQKGTLGLVDFTNEFLTTYKYSKLDIQFELRQKVSEMTLRIMAAFGIGQTEAEYEAKDLLGVGFGK